MKFLYRKYPAKKKDVVEVMLDKPVKVKFMTAAEFRKYTGGRTHTYFNGQEEDSVLRFTVPFDGVWHVVVEKGKNGELVDVTAQCRLRLPEPGEMEHSGNDRGDDLSLDEAEVQAISMGSRSEG